VRLPGGIHHDPDKYLTQACNTHTHTHTHGGVCVCQTLQLQCRPAQLAALLLSPLVRNDSDQTRGGLNLETLAPYRKQERHGVTHPISDPHPPHPPSLSLSPPGFHHLISPQCKCQARAARGICEKAHHGTHKKTSLRRPTRQKGERGKGGG